MIAGILAQCTVSDLSTAEKWYSGILGRVPDSRPMDGLLEWHLGDGFGLQVWLEPDRAGGSSVVLEETDLDTAADRAAADGAHHDGPQPGGGRRILQLTDPDGNRVVLMGH